MIAPRVMQQLADSNEDEAIRRWGELESQILAGPSSPERSRRSWAWWVLTTSVSTAIWIVIFLVIRWIAGLL